MSDNIPSFFGLTIFEMPGGRLRHRNVPGETATGSAGDDEITHDRSSLDYWDQPLIRIEGGAGDDTFYGDPGELWGGVGNDTFYNSGISQFATSPAAGAVAKVRGGAGHDRFIDFTGSSDYYGDRGRDYFTNFYFTTHGDDGDLDRVHLGAGRDSAYVFFNDLPDRWESEQIWLDGGAGIDTLRLAYANGIWPLTLASEVDFRDAGTGVFQLLDRFFTGFETFELRFGTPVVDKIILGENDDLFQWYGDTGSPGRTIEICGRGGNDMIIAANGTSRDVIFGNAGDDILVGDGGFAGNSDVLRGGAGDDILFVGGLSVQHYDTRMIGGAGRDTFVFARGYSENIVIEDFVAGHDTLVFSLAGSVLSRAAPPNNVFSYDYAFADKRVEKRTKTMKDAWIVEDSERRVVIRLEDVGRFNDFDFQLNYNKETGRIWYLDDLNGGTWTSWGRIEGAPDLDAEDFHYFNIL